MTKDEAIGALKYGTLVETTKEHAKITGKYRVGKILNIKGSLVVLSTKDGPAGSFLFSQIQLVKEVGCENGY